MDALKQLQDLLRELFQLDFADLDFGLYRLLHIKRNEIEAFLTDQLPNRSKEAFQGLATEENTNIGKELSELAKRIRNEIADDAILENGDLNPDYRKTKVKAAQTLIKAYEVNREKERTIQVSEAQQIEVFNHLYAFFSRYYESGDFIPRRRYGARETYAVPYNGEEVFFHWANKDQHYVKTAQNFRDYAFSVETVGGSYRVRFLITEANLPQGNIKGDTRYFFPVPEQAVFNQESKEFRLPFHYRLPTDQEVITHGKNSRFQESVLLNSLPKLMQAVPDSLLQAALGDVIEQREEQQITLLLKRLRHFCRKNTTDYFIHKDLKGFLTQELEFYLKDQVLHLADLDADVEGRIRTIRVIRKLGEEIILFLSQIEEVEKRLFEKRKFVLRTDYLVPIKEVPEKLWGEVLKNQSQLQAWKELFAIDPEVNLFNQKGKVNKHFLQEHPTLVVNTSFFDQDFKDRLLSSFDDLDEATDGLLIHSENYQALRFLERKYANQIKCIYIDPPYNTGNDDFIYKDRYRHSSWLAMMAERLNETPIFLGANGILLMSCDDNEFERLRLWLSTNHPTPGLTGTIVWKARLFTDARSTTGISLDHEYILVQGPGSQTRFRGARKDLSKYSNPDNDPRGSWTSCSLLGKATRAQRPNLHYSFQNPKTGEVYSCPENTGWICAKDTMQGYIEAESILWPKKLRGRPRQKVFLNELKSEYMGFPSIIDDVYTSDGTIELRDILGAQLAPFPKPSELVARLIEQSDEADSVVLDFFAGTGTTGHAVIGLNRRDSIRRKFILVEMADYFHKILLPRILKVMYAPEWKDGKPNRLPSKEEIERTPRLIKVLRLESYEDALHNLTTEETTKRATPRDKAYKKTVGDHEYRLSYLVRLPLEANASLLNLAALEHPFAYKIEVLSDSGPREEKVDLIETFNFLLGVHVERLETWTNGKDKRTYRIVKARDRTGQRILIIWRDMKELDPVVERHFLEPKIKSEGPFNEAFINGDTATPGIKSLDGIFKRLVEGVEK